MHVLDNKISESDIDGLKIFQFYEHPEIRSQIEVMKTEVMKYQVKQFELVEVKLCNVARIHVRVRCSSDKLTQFVSD
jgi:hypothetical protein